ncbi:MAG: hypothetical protein LBE12_20450 [Planctomycetaceae bacterium]|nr:hypothetical protein [Planctomycetaceae bacterium]
MFLETYKCIKESWDLLKIPKNLKIRFEKSGHEIFLCKDLSLWQYFDNLRRREYRQLFLSLYCYPYIDDENNNDDVLVSSFYLEKNKESILIQGLGLVHYFDTVGIGFLSEPYWDNILFSIEKITDNKTEKVSVLCLSKPEHVNGVSFQKWLEKQLPVEIQSCNINVSQKKIHLRDDHGKDVLQIFAEKIIQSDYVCSVINSLPFNPNCKKFIKNVYHNGKIEIVLTKTDRGLGVIVQTTGRNKQETEKIAEILKKEYDK